MTSVYFNKNIPHGASVFKLSPLEFNPISEAIDYHFYAAPASRTDASTYASMFERGDEFIEYVKQIELIRKRLAPQTKSYLKELGVIAPGDNQLDPAPLPDIFWSAKAAYWAYLFSQLALLKIDVASMSQLVGGNPLTCMHPNGTSCSTNSGPPTPTRTATTLRRRRRRRQRPPPRHLWTRGRCWPLLRPAPG